MANPECLEPGIEEDIAGLLKVSLTLLLLVAIKLLPSKSTGILQSIVVIFNGFFIFPFLALHEVGHVVIFFMFYDPENIVIVLERDPPWGYVPGSDYAKGFPKSLIVLGGPFVDFFFLSLFAVYLLKQKGYQRAISGIKGKYIPQYSSGEIYAAYGVMINLYAFLGSMIPFAYDAKGDEFHNDFFLFWELNGFGPPDFSHGGLAPKVLYYVLKLPALFFACLFIIYIFSPVIANTRELYERKYSLFRAGKKESKGMN
ncbi:MAG: hypothetical protein ACE5OZ_23235 [Candidatus Heimdallarchaeota archaeon]